MQVQQWGKGQGVALISVRRKCEKKEKKEQKKRKKNAHPRK